MLGDQPSASLRHGEDSLDETVVLKVLSFETQCCENIRNSHRSREALEARAGVSYKTVLHPFPALSVWDPLKTHSTCEPNLGPLLSHRVSFLVGSC